jgi:Mrp family chromosome partitioning ATPase
MMQAKASLAEHQTSLRELTGADAKTGLTNMALNVPAEEVARYKSICARLNMAERRQNDYIQQGYTDDNKLVKENRAAAVAAANTKQALERKYPPLVDLDTTVGAVAPASGMLPTEASESVQTAALPLRIKELQAQLDEIQAEAAKLDDAEAKIADLERKKDLQEANYKYFVSMLDQARIDEALGPGRVSNLPVIQQPSHPYKDYGKFYKTMGVIACSGLFLGLAWAFLIEFYLDRTVKRPVDLHTKLRIPFFLSIPDLDHNSVRARLAGSERARLTAGETAGAVAVRGSGAVELASVSVNHALHPHYDALRDRLVNYFESINLTRKPKLVAVTSTNIGAGVSTIAAGLAASLSETGDGRVLLVDMNEENGAAQQFVRGKPSCQLDDALASETRDNALVQENLYVVSEGTASDNLPRVLPKRFAALVPKLKASDYDYIIFDMPPVSQTSVTTRLAGFMDTVMLVVESEKTDRDVVLQANQLLVQAKGNVTAVLNKTRNYIPARLQHDIQAGM